MAVIDADTHVDETEFTWLPLEGALAKHAPATMTPPMEEIQRGKLNPDRSRFWLVEGRLPGSGGSGRHPPPTATPA